MSQHFYYCELCNEVRFTSAEHLVEFHYTTKAHKYELPFKVHSLKNNEAKELVLRYLNAEKVKEQQKQQPEPNFDRPRKCELCSVEVPKDYEDYAIHVMNYHNLGAAKSDIKDPFIYSCIANGQIKDRNCEICSKNIGKKVMDYILHINTTHKQFIIDRELKKYVKDPYVISVLFNTDMLGPSCTTICPHCGEELDMLDTELMKKHKEKHMIFNSSFKSSRDVENQYSNIFNNNNLTRLNNYDNYNNNTLNNFSGNFNLNNTQKNIIYEQNNISKENINNKSNINSTSINNFSNSSNINSTSFNNSSSIPFPNNNINNNYEKKIDLLDNIMDISDKLSSIGVEKNALSNQAPNIIIINQTINSNNTNSDVKTYSNSKVNTNINSNNKSSAGLNDSELKELKSQIENLKLKLSAIENEQKKAEDEKKNLAEYIQKKFDEKDFQMSQIEKELIRIDELDLKINSLNTEIANLKKSDEELNSKIDLQESKLIKLEEKLEERITELQKQYTFLNQQQGTVFSDKLVQVEKELVLLQARVEKEKGKNSEVDFSLPSHWCIQKDYLLVVNVDMLSNEYSKIETLFQDTYTKTDGFIIARKNKKAKIISIKRLQNTETWKNYCFAKHQLLLKGNAEELFLFHGSSTTDPCLIYEGKEEGFDLRFARGGYYGNAIYFHINSGYSDDYAYTTKNGTKILLVANILVGNYVELDNDLETSKFRHPPFIPGKKERYDSVKGKKYDKFMIYNNLRAYPHYLIEYKDI
jgi:hypothetical protein